MTRELIPRDQAKQEQAGTSWIDGRIWHKPACPSLRAGPRWSTCASSVVGCAESSSEAGDKKVTPDSRLHSAGSLRS